MNNKINDLIAYSEKGILSKILVKNEKINSTLFCMAKDTDLSEHTSTKQGFVYVIEGKGIFTLEGEDIVMEPGTCIYMQENAIHSLKVIENTSFVLALVNN